MCFLFIFLVFAIFIPIVWKYGKIVNKIFDYVDFALNFPKIDTDKILSDKEILNKNSIENLNFKRLKLKPRKKQTEFTKNNIEKKEI